MYVRVVRPDNLDTDALDRFLERGWYRIGQTMMTCRVVMFGGHLRSAAWLRLPVLDHAFKRSHRKLMSRIRRRFDVQVGPIERTPEHDALYARYREAAQGERAESLDQLLYGERTDVELFDTREVSFRDDGRLVAFSWFDRGERSLQSVVGVYDPDAKPASLGFATMLFEVEEGRRTGRPFYYPGYVLQGAPAMDYKLRLGELQAWDPDKQEWRPYQALTAAPMALDRLRGRLAAVADELARRGRPSESVDYPHFELSAYAPRLSRCLDHPVALRVAKTGPGRDVLVTWDPDRQRYRVCATVEAAAIVRGADGSERHAPEIALRVVVDHLGGAPTAAAAAELVTRRVRHRE